ncbi:uncharacterized protein LTR77_005673 [Saxophila tyrrhenica]|uniref:Uncharacterized protein n=1 Tax=Saxophila tyrrhenica TaxID=1690608 RepID=A0AAV9P9X9_9PEZI|nr:hypothetical protein LTR77_005673 [Saxophila tyrrhenica]
MASSYFTLPSFARAKKNKEDLEKTNPQEPVLKDEDEKFLEKQISTDDAAKPQQSDEAPATQITDDGEEKEVSKEEAGGDVVVPETQPEINVAGGDGATEGDAGQSADKEESQTTEQSTEGATGDQQSAGQGDDGATDDATYDDKMKEEAAEAKKARKAKKDDMDLPSQEDAEAATRGFNAQANQEVEQPQSEKRTWTSYIPSVRPSSRKAADTSTDQPSAQPDQPSSEATTTEGESSATPQRTWTQYATSIVPSLPASWKKSSKPDPDADPQPVYNEDGTINESETAAQQEREVSVLLDNLNLSSINNRVFPLTAETQKYYDRFAQCLKDSINGAPTAYDDMDKLMREAGPRLEEQFKSMPPFVQTLVKSLPAKMGSVVGPELLAAASEKPGNDMKTRMEAASRPDSGVNIPDAPAASSEVKEADEGDGKKKKRTIPGLKSLVGEKSAVASMLRSAVTFIQTRFPFLASMTNVVMSLAVFILMFVFWYCHKRGKEVRLAREAADAEGGDEGDLEEIETSDEDEDVEKVIDELERGDADVEKEVDEKANVLSQPNPTEVPVPADEKDTAAAGEQRTET